MVGEVIQTGQPRRVDAAAEPRPRSIATSTQQLRYQTRTLLCVPLRGRSGELFGAFELINKLAGDVHRGRRRGAGRTGRPRRRGPGKRPEIASSCSRANRQIAEQAAEKVRLIGESPAIEALRSIIRRVADTDLAVLILGENGTGKEVVAQSIHYLSRRRDQPFIAVNCAAIPETLAESELFGHEKGAFTDAREARQGKFELAAGGTLVSRRDRRPEPRRPGQAAPRAGREGRWCAWAARRRSTPTPGCWPPRIRTWPRWSGQKRFREDLYFRLNVVTLDLPPLRERGDDVLLLAEHFLTDFCRKARRKPPQLLGRRRESGCWSTPGRATSASCGT